MEDYKQDIKTFRLPQSIGEITEVDYSSHYLNSFSDEELSHYPRVKKDLSKAYTTLLNIEQCGTHDIIYFCTECTHVKKIPFMCTNRYCVNSDCVAFRIKQSFRILNSFHYKPRRVFEFVIGSNKQTKKDLEKTISKLIYYLRKLGYRMDYLKIFDISKKNYDKTGKYWLHFHILLMPEKLDVRKFMSLCKIKLLRINPKAVYSNAGWRYTLRKYKYVAKRMAGKFGHSDEGYFYLQDLVNPLEYLEYYHNSKFLTWSSPNGLINKTRDSSPQNLCEKCGAPMFMVARMPHNGFNVLDPPTDQEIPSNVSGLTIEKWITEREIE